MTVLADGTTATRNIAARTYTQTGFSPQQSWSGSFLSLGAATPDGQGGVLATWAEQFVDAPSKYMVSHVSASGQADFYLPALDNMNPTGPGNSLPGTVILDGTGQTGFVTSTSGFSTPNTVVAFDTTSGQQLWVAQPGILIQQMFAQDAGGALVQGINSSNQWFLYPIDGSGSVGSPISTGSVLTDSWSGQWYSVGPNIQSANLPFVVDQASFWPESYGNPSQSGFGVPGCPCLNQSSDSTLPSQPQTTTSLPKSEAPAESAQVSAENMESAQLSGPSNCPICNIPQPDPSLCVTLPGNGATYLILVGDRGLNNPNGTNHDVGDLFNLAAQQKANDLQSQGNKVIACRISSIQDFHQQLTQNGLITGDVIYFGHSGLRGFTNGPNGAVYAMASLIFIGEQAGADTNIAAYNNQQIV